MRQGGSCALRRRAEGRQRRPDDLDPPTEDIDDFLVRVPKPIRVRRSWRNRGGPAVTYEQLTLCQVRGAGALAGAPFQATQPTCVDDLDMPTEDIDDFLVRGPGPAEPPRSWVAIGPENTNSHGVEVQAPPLPRFPLVPPPKAHRPLPSFPLLPPEPHARSRG